DCKIARFVQPPRDLSVVTGSDRTEQREERLVVRPVALRAGLRHADSLPPPARGVTSGKAQDDGVTAAASRARLPTRGTAGALAPAPDVHLDWWRGLDLLGSSLTAT